MTLGSEYKLESIISTETLFLGPWPRSNPKWPNWGPQLGDIDACHVLGEMSLREPRVLYVAAMRELHCSSPCRASLPSQCGRRAPLHSRSSLLAFLLCLPRSLASAHACSAQAAMSAWPSSAAATSLHSSAQTSHLFSFLAFRRTRRPFLRAPVPPKHVAAGATAGAAACAHGRAVPSSCWPSHLSTRVRTGPGLAVAPLRRWQPAANRRWLAPSQPRAASVFLCSLL